MEDFIKEELASLEAKGLKRALRSVSGPQGPRVIIDGREVILLCSNDYLGLANHPLVKEAAIKAIEKYGVGAGASRLVSGNMEPHGRLEERIKEFKATEAALLFNSGYNANLALVSVLADRSTEIFSDRLNHASVVDACRLSRAGFKRYPHRDARALEGLLQKSTAKRKIIITDGVFSMDGTIAPLPEITSLLDGYGALLIVDDAHSTGVLGVSGRGTLEHFSISHPSVIQMGTLGKALGVFGAFVAGSSELIGLLISKARPFIYTTALPPSVCEAAVAAIDIADKTPELRERLWENVRVLKEGLSGAGLDTMGSSSPIIPVLTGDESNTMELSRTLLDRGVFIQGIRPPTVPEGTSRLRITVTAAHTSDDIEEALGIIDDVLGAVADNK